MALDNLRGGTKRVVEENTPLNNLRGGTKRVILVGGGGGSDDAVPQYSTMPAPSESNLGQVAQYIGPNTSDAPAAATIEQTVGTSLSSLAVNVSTFIAAEQPTGDETVSFVADVVEHNYFDATAEFGSTGVYASFDTDKLLTYIATKTTHTDYDYIEVTFKEENKYNLRFYFNSIISGWLKYFSVNSATESDMADMGITVSATTSETDAKAKSNWNGSVVTWKKGTEDVNIASYGITYSGTPANQDELTVTYTAQKFAKTHAYIYESTKTITYTGSATFEPATVSGATIYWDIYEFIAFLQQYVEHPEQVASGTLTYYYDTAATNYMWEFVAKDSDGVTIATETISDGVLYSSGFNPSDTPQENDVVAFTCTIAVDTVTYSWNQTNVQQPIQLELITGYDETKSQTLKNVYGTISWVDD